MLLYQNMMSLIRKWIVEMYTVFPVAVGNRSIDRYFLPNRIKYRVWHGTVMTNSTKNRRQSIHYLIEYYKVWFNLWTYVLFVTTNHFYSQRTKYRSIFLVDFSFVLLRKLLAVIILCFLCESNLILLQIDIWAIHLWCWYSCWLFMCIAEYFSSLNFSKFWANFKILLFVHISSNILKVELLTAHATFKNKFKLNASSQF